MELDDSQRMKLEDFKTDSGSHINLRCILKQLCLYRVPWETLPASRINLKSWRRSHILERTTSYFATVVDISHQPMESCCFRRICGLLRAAKKLVCIEVTIKMDNSLKYAGKLLAYSLHNVKLYRCIIPCAYMYASK